MTSASPTSPRAPDRRVARRSANSEPITRPSASRTGRRCASRHAGTAASRRPATTATSTAKAAAPTGTDGVSTIPRSPTAANQERRPTTMPTGTPITAARPTIDQDEDGHGPHHLAPLEAERAQGGELGPVAAGRRRQGVSQAGQAEQGEERRQGDEQAADVLEVEQAARRVGPGVGREREPEGLVLEAGLERGDIGVRGVGEDEVLLLVDGEVGDDLGGHAAPWPPRRCRTAAVTTRPTTSSSTSSVVESRAA